jgi:hypothetical protein
MQEVMGGCLSVLGAEAVHEQVKCAPHVVVGRLAEQLQLPEGYIVDVLPALVCDRLHQLHQLV